MLEHVVLEQEQNELLMTLVEASRNVPTNQRQKFEFWLFRADQGDIAFLQHPGLPDGRLDKFYRGDLEALADAGFVRLTRRSRDLSEFDITPQGFRYYAFLKQQVGKPTQQVETAIKRYLESDRFQQTYPRAYEQWEKAETLLWAADSERQLTTIGHLCREAIQEFATVLVEKYQPPDVEADKAKDISRIRAVLQVAGSELGGRERDLLDALLGCWRAVSGLIQQLEHGNQKQGRVIMWEDARRAVFQVANVMFEIDHSLSRSS